ncbi:class I lanthipeptide [uncultured Alistipes sp.]|jgi:hypothetical protein|uniref:class I lanthipeptide n=1 Tax=uncultured Alistipes sp. TaxID=538949 RepID=UPI0025DA7C38|nr:class I lanthipeptide [uncultured Alistipes sp.]
MKKLQLKKEVVAGLSGDQMNQVKGGTAISDCFCVEITVLNCEVFSVNCDSVIECNASRVSQCTFCACGM